MASPPATRLFYDTSPSVVRLTWHEPLPGSDVPEAVVQAIWQEQRLTRGALRTTSGAPVEVIFPGQPNADGGPDFRFARLRIGETVWFGDVEVHTTSRGWHDHRHADDPVYNSVVLHVVLQPDLWTGRLHRSDGTALPELVLAPHLDGAFRARLVHFFTRPAAARPCAWGFDRLTASTLHAWLAECARERLLRQRAAFEATPEASLLDRVYEAVAAGLGFRPNAAPMRRLAVRVPLAELRILRSARDREALLLGMAGLLPASPAATGGASRAADHAYEASLVERFEALRPRGHAPLGATEWQYTRLRPANFPEVRIVQLAALTAPGGPLSEAGWQRVCAALAGGHVEAMLADLDAEPHAYWQSHYRLGVPAAAHPARIGRTTGLRLLVNAFLPAALAAAEGDPALLDAALSILRALPAEDDRLVRSFSFPPGVRPRLIDTQGLHELDQAYCRASRCLACAVGRTLLGRSAVSSDPAHPLASAPCSSASSTSPFAPTP